MKLAVFASGNGSNFAAIAEAVQQGSIPGAQLSLLVSDEPGCYALERARQLGVPAVSFSPSQFGSKAEFEVTILEWLNRNEIDLVALAGYMRLVGPALLEPYQGRIVNIHPSLLPAFPGRTAIADALAAGVSETGVTIHFIDSGIDTGPVIDQRRVQILEGDTLESLSSRVHEVEHDMYPQVLAKLISERNREMNPQVGVIMGSSSDWETMRNACKVLDLLGIPYEKRVVSAHRTPDVMFEYAETARARGLRVIIAGAGGAAHLPGMVASKTTLPVVGVPVQSRALSGLDSLLSIVQMPGGIPVATTAIGNAGATNAGLLAAQILGAFDQDVSARLEIYRNDLRQAVEASNEQLR